MLSTLCRLSLPAYARAGYLAKRSFLGATLAAGLAAQTVSIVQTNADKSALLAPQPPVKFGKLNTQSLTINIDETHRYQRMDGFGASFTDSSAWLVWTKLTPAQRDQLMRSLFTTAGANLSFLRQPMGASDLALSNYTYDDLPIGQTDPELKHFSIDHDKAYILPVLRQALALNPHTTVMGLPWSPPAWMKLPQSTNGGSFDEQYFPALARYFTKFIHAYAENGVRVTRIAVQNEPLNNNTGYPTEYLTDSQEAHFIGKYLGPQLVDRRSPQETPVQILGYEHNWDVQWYAEWLLRHPEAARYISGISFHCYAGDPTTAYSTIHEFFPDKGLWFTECSGTVGSQFSGDLDWNTEHLTIGSVRSGAKSVALWNMALDQKNGPINGQGCQTCRGLVTIDWSTAPATVSYNVEYYVLGQAARFVVPGAYHVESNSYGTGSIEDVAFQNPDGSLALLVYNSAQSATPFSVAWKGRTFSYTLPAGSVATFAWQSDQSGARFSASPDAQTIAQGDTARIRIEGDDHDRWQHFKVTGAPDGTDVDVFGHEVFLHTSPSTPTGAYSISISSEQEDPAAVTAVQLTVGAPATPFGGTAPDLPGVIQAENWDAGDRGIAFYNPDLFTHPDASPYRPGQDVSLEMTSDAGGGYDVSYIGAGEWLDYTANVTASGLYSMRSRLASQFGGTYYHVEVDGRNVTGPMYFPNTGGWQTFITTGSPMFWLNAGPHVFRYVFDSNNANGGVGNFNWFALAPAGLGVSQPYGGTPAAVPGVVQTENFDTGGKNVAYYDAASTNQGGQYRTSDTIGIEQTSDVGGGYDVAYTEPGEWMNYTVNVTAERDYTMHVRVAVPVPGGTFHVACDGQNVTGSVTIPETSGWQGWQTINVPWVHLPAGEHVLQFIFESPGAYTTPGNLNWFSFD